LSKYDLNGNRIWTKVIGISGAAGTGINGVVLDSVGNIYVTGFHGPGNFQGCTTTALYAGYVAKFDTNGNFQWTTCTGNAQRHYYNGLIIDASSDVVALGSTYDSPIDGMSFSSGLDQSIILQKFNPTTGARITGTIIPGNGALGTDGHGISVDSAGKIYVAGVSRASSYCGIGTSAYWRPVLFRFNSSMAYINCTFIPVTATTFTFGITATPTGESFLSGYADHNGLVDGFSPIGTTDGYVTKFNSSGSKLWTQRIGVAGARTIINSVVYEPTSDKLYFTGLTAGNLQGNAITGTRDMFVAKHSNDGSGTQIWLKMQGIKNDTNGLALGDGTGIVFDSNKTLYSFGDTNGTIGGQTNPASPNRSMFLVRNLQ
jgi:hypothetical protein